MKESLYEAGNKLKTQMKDIEKELNNVDILINRLKAVIRAGVDNSPTIMVRYAKGAQSIEVPLDNTEALELLTARREGYLEHLTDLDSEFKNL